MPNVTPDYEAAAKAAYELLMMRAWGDIRQPWGSLQQYRREDWIAAIKFAVDAATLPEREWAAKKCESFKPGWTLSIPHGILIRDVDGPWGLGSDFAADIRRG